MKSLILSGLLLIVMYSCTTTPTADENVANTAEEESEVRLSKEQIDSLIEFIDSKRALAEDKKDNRIELLTENLREKIKQKWQKIHYYLDGNSVIRIKTYPYENISKRTEEFYFYDGKLILAIIRDSGVEDSEDRNKGIDKMYYFNNDAVLKEVNLSDEKEFTIRESDGEELLSEAAEYLTLLPK
ncbi:hypothetical protein [Thermaurantimonas aggregans]|nr:hypothetical protein [Thermaurantimonas aggregans]MCX8149639.1 hypothetical protein [Thermaurantimonas aggregans]